MSVTTSCCSQGQWTSTWAFPGRSKPELFYSRSPQPAAGARAALSKAAATQAAATHEALPMDINGGQHFVDIVAEPIPNNNDGLCVVSFLTAG